MDQYLGKVSKIVESEETDTLWKDTYGLELNDEVFIWAYEWLIPMTNKK